MNKGLSSACQQGVAEGRTGGMVSEGQGVGTAKMLFE